MNSNIQPQRSPVDVLLRVFPTRRRSEVEQLLQRYRGDVVQAMEAMLSGEDIGQTINIPVTSPSFQMKSAFSPLVPASTMFSTSTAAAAAAAAAAANRYPFMQTHTKRFLTAPYAGTGYLSSVIQSESDQSQSNDATSNERNGNNNVTDTQE